jgi:hydrogenase nickel incorporation protein HypA/HybF
MHEVHIVQELAATVEREAAAQGAKRVTRLKLRFNPLVSHDASHVQFCFDVVKQESELLKEAELVLIAVPGLVRCRDCQHEFETDELPNLCPKCGSVSLTPLHATELVLESFDIER